MLELIIPTIGVAVQVHTGSVAAWERRDWMAYEHSVQEIIKEPGMAFKYPHMDFIGAHDYLAFSNLDELEYNDLVIYNQTRYRVKYWEIVRSTNTRAIDPKQNTSPLTLMTCEGDRRLLFYAE